MAERKREIQVKFWVTPEEKKMIRKKMILSRTANMGAYLRKMVIDGIIVNTDTTYLEKHFFEMHDSTTADTTGADVVKNTLNQANYFEGSAEEAQVAMFLKQLGIKYSKLPRHTGQTPITEGDLEWILTKLL